MICLHSFSRGQLSDLRIIYGKRVTIRISGCHKPLNLNNKGSTNEGDCDLK